MQATYFRWAQTVTFAMPYRSHWVPARGSLCPARLEPNDVR
jgi:hypothetical protein